MLATKWDMSADGKVWTITLRDNVYFHQGTNKDGTPYPSTKMTADDVVYSLVRSGNQEAYFGAFWRAQLGDTAEARQAAIEVVDPSTLRITLVKGNTAFARMSSYGAQQALAVVPKAYTETNGAAWLQTHPIGTGPYRVTQVFPGDRVESEAVDNHWSGKVPSFQKIVEYLIPEDNTMVGLLKTDKLDVAPVSLTSAIDLAANRKDLSVFEGKNQQQADFIAIGTSHEKAAGLPLADPRVRQALSLAINRPELISTLYNGQASLPALANVAWSFGDLSGPTVAKWKDWTDKNYVYDPAKAQSLLAQAGYGPGGKPLQFDVWSATDPSYPGLNEMVLAVAAYWARVGAQANIIPVDIATYQANRNTRQSDKMIGKMAVTVGGSNYEDTPERLKRWTSLGTMDYLVGSPLEGQMDSLYNEAGSNVSQDRREAIIDTMFQNIADTWVSFGVVSQPEHYAAGPALGKFDAFPVAYTTALRQDYANWQYAGK